MDKLIVLFLIVLKTFFGQCRLLFFLTNDWLPLQATNLRPAAYRTANASTTWQGKPGISHVIKIPVSRQFCEMSDNWMVFIQLCPSVFE